MSVDAVMQHHSELTRLGVSDRPGADGRQCGLKTVVLCTLLAVSWALSAARVAHAEPTWVLADGGGCAIATAVGANDIPWAIGCGGTPGVFYLENVRSCTGTLCVAKTQWVDAHKTGALNLTVNLNGIAFITDTSGELWEVGYIPDTIGAPNTWISLQQ